MDSRFREFVDLFNREKFFEAHEVLESLWRATHDTDKDFYQGLIQLAAAMVHVRKNTPCLPAGRLPGAEDLYAKAERHFSKYPKYHCGLDCAKILSDVRKTLDLKTGFPKIT